MKRAKIKLRISNYRLALLVLNILRVFPWGSKSFNRMQGEAYYAEDTIDEYYLIEFK